MYGLLNRETSIVPGAGISSGHLNAKWPNCLPLESFFGGYQMDLLAVSYHLVSTTTSSTVCIPQVITLQTLFR